MIGVYAGVSVKPEHVEEFLASAPPSSRHRARMRAISATISALPPVRPLRVSRALSRLLSVGSHSRHSKHIWRPSISAPL
ncbi:Uncharacterised protein [Rothia dentocariosa]|uniref:Uncharacterized protein n=1 Tax=Rothia dentocariosa TaxID=2047 RepID=A0A3S4YJB9_9MICC|nr:Uncharacterised protein [Rothia dentocariosa]